MTGHGPHWPGSMTSCWRSPPSTNVLRSPKLPSVAAPAPLVVVYYLMGRWTSQEALRQGCQGSRGEPASSRQIQCTRATLPLRRERATDRWSVGAATVDAGERSIPWWSPHPDGPRRGRRRQVQTDVASTCPAGDRRRPPGCSLRPSPRRGRGPLEVRHVQHQPGDIDGERFDHGDDDPMFDLGQLGGADRVHGVPEPAVIDRSGRQADQVVPGRGRPPLGEAEFGARSHTRFTRASAM